VNSVIDWLQLPAIQRIGWTLLHFLWQGTAIAWLAALVLAAMRNRSAAARYVTSCVAMLALGAAPAMTFLLIDPPPMKAVAMTAAPTRGDVRSTVAGDGERRRSGGEEIVATPPAISIDRAITPAVRPVAIQPPLVAATPTTPSKLDTLFQQVSPFVPWFVAVWLIGVMLLSIRLASGWIVTQRLRRHGDDAPGTVVNIFTRLLDRAGIRKPIRLLISSAAGVPSMIGAWRPVILLPASVLTGLTPRQLEAILAHELAHIRRHDYLVNLLQCVLETLLFYHPAVWWISARMRREREDACDDLAVQWAGDRLTVARALTAIEELRGPAMPLALAAADGALLQRVKRLLGHAPRRNGGAIWPLLVLASLMVSVAVGCHIAAQAAVPATKPIATATDPASAKDAPAKLDPAALRTERDRLLAIADAKIRTGLRELATKYPQLGHIASGSSTATSLEQAMGEPTPGSIGIGVNWPPVTKTGPMLKVPAEETYNFSVILREPSPYPVAAADFGPVYPTLNLMGWKKASAGDPKLAAAMEALIVEALAPLEALERSQAHAEPVVPAPTTCPAGKLEPAALMRERDRLLAVADNDFRDGILILADKFPQLRQAAVGATKKESLVAALDGSSKPGTISIQVNWPPRTKAGPTFEIPEAERYDVTISLYERPADPVAAGDLTSFYPKLKIVGRVGMAVGDIKLAAAIQALMKETLAPLAELNKAQEEADAANWSEPVRGLSFMVEPAKAEFIIGEPVEVIWTFKNLTNRPIKILNVAQEFSDYFHQYQFTDTTDKPIASTAPQHSFGNVKQFQEELPAGGTIEHRATLNGWKLAGLGHPYTPIGDEQRVFYVRPHYMTRVGNDIKDPKVWLGEIEGRPTQLRIVPKQHPLAKLSIDAANDEKAIAEAKATGEKQAAEDLAAGKAVILYYGKPWSAGKPLVNDATGLPVEILSGCAVTPRFVAGVDAYNAAVRNAKVKHPPQVPPDAPKAAKDVEQPLMEAWGKIEAIDHPLLVGIKEGGFDAAHDKQGLRNLGARFTRNATWKPKAAGPDAEDATKPYIWIQVSLWRKDIPSQPPPAARPYKHDPNYTYLVVVKSSDAELQKKLEAILSP
jgi:beta-lactamase regulating signal transducer with metallopeptidase domain